MSVSDRPRPVHVTKAVNGGAAILYWQGYDLQAAYAARDYGCRLHAERCPKDSVVWKVIEL
jgi:hypothetical protein